MLSIVGTDRDQFPHFISNDDESDVVGGTAMWCVPDGGGTIVVGTVRHQSGRRITDIADREVLCV